MSHEISEQSRELFQLVVENVEDFAVYAKDLGGRIVSWNPGVERLLGYEEAEWVGQHISIIFTPEDRERQVPEREMETALRLGRAEDQWWLVRKDGSLFWANGLLMLLRDEAGEARGFAKILRNDTARKRAEDALRDSEQVLDHLIRNIPGGSISVFDREIRYLFAGGQGLTQVGLSPEKWSGSLSPSCSHGRRSNTSPLTTAGRSRGKHSISSWRSAGGGSSSAPRRSKTPKGESTRSSRWRKTLRGANMLRMSCAARTTNWSSAWKSAPPGCSR